MTSSSRLILIFTIVFAILIINPAFLSQQFGPYPLLKWGDVTDILTPLILIPLYWLLFRQGKPPSTLESILFLVFTAFWVEGQGIHLSANSIGHLLDSAKGTDGQLLTHFYDEVLGHYLWHIGMVALTGLLIWRQIENPLKDALTTLWAEIISAVIYGIVYFIIVIEAGTVPLGLPFAILMSIVGLMRRKDLRQQPITLFFVAAHGLALILFVIWFVRWGGFPQFSELGLI
ncbi:MAG: hypothetical protein ABI700_08815 [Chloroflexota bacterium]